MSDSLQPQDPTADPAEIPQEDLDAVSGGRTLPYDPITIPVLPGPCFPTDPIIVDSL